MRHCLRASSRRPLRLAEPVRAMMTPIAAVPEFSRPFDAKTLASEGVAARHLTATPEERQALARRLGLLDLKFLDADLDIRPWRGVGFAISGHFKAEVVQACVVSLDPVASDLDGEVQARFLPSAMIPPEDVELDADLDAPEPPERLSEDGIIDLGELVVQHLAIAIDPYPRKPGARFTPEESSKSEVQSPFAVLEALRRRRDPQNK